MDARRPQGQYRTQPADGHTPMAYVLGGGSPSYVTEAHTGPRAICPTSTLPTEDEYDTQSS